jgi:hypothetical protein
MAQFGQNEQFGAVGLTNHSLKTAQIHFRAAKGGMVLDKADFHLVFSATGWILLRNNLPSSRLFSKVFALLSPTDRIS